MYCCIIAQDASIIRNFSLFSFSSPAAYDFVYLPSALKATNSRIGVVGDVEVRNAFKDYLYEEFTSLDRPLLEELGCKVNGPKDAPELNYFPSFDGLVLSDFETSEQLNDYVLQDGYGFEDHIPSIAMAVEFTKHGPLVSPGRGHWEYRIRVNSTTIPNMYQDVDELQISPRLFNLETYTYSTPEDILTTSQSNFLPFQLAVDRFILNTMAPTEHSSLLGDTTNFGVYWNCTNMPEIGKEPQELKDFFKSHLRLPQRPKMAPFPVSGYRNVTFYDIVSNVFALVFVMSFFFPSFYLIRGIVVEKETKIREGMRMMGFKDSALVCAWYITYILMFCVVAICIAITAKVSFFPKSDGGLLFLFFWLFGISAIGLCYLLSVFFSRAKTASVVGALIFIATFFPYFNVSDMDKKASIKSAASLASPVSFGLALDIISAMEAAELGVNWTTAHKVVHNYSVSQAFAWMAFDTFLYTLLAVYLSGCIPQEFGVPLPFYYPFTSQYWFPDESRDVWLPQAIWNYFTGRSKSSRGYGQQSLPYSSSGESSISALDTNNAFALGKKGNGATASLLQNAHNHDGLSEQSYLTGLPRHIVDSITFAPSGDTIEPPSLALQDLARAGRCVSVRGLTKSFNTPDGVKVAVDNLDLDMYEGQIFCLLGHNGAGKTTTISMLSGLIPPTTGDAYIFGQSIRSELPRIRRSLGVCPQHDVLWPDLTVREHLEYFAGVKGVPKEQVNHTVNEILRQIGLTEKVDTFSKDLSGGMKRKLSVGIALVGDSKVVFLDEPTSGMDPYSRRSTWQILQNARSNRVMVLTTHFMDEADILGDRIGIMADGTIACCGSSMFLKKLFGVGYVLTFSRKPSTKDSVELDKERTEKIKQLIANAIPESSVLSAVGAEISFQLPLSSSGSFPPLFAEIEKNLDVLGLDSYGVSVTTLEEVFLKVAEGDADMIKSRAKDNDDLNDEGALRLKEEAAARATAAKNSALGIEDPNRPIDTFSREKAGPQSNVFLKHFVALFIKRAKFSFRDRKALIFQLAIPALALLGGLLLLRQLLALTNLPPTKVDFTHYNTKVPVTMGDKHYPPNYVPFGIPKSPEYSGEVSKILDSMIHSKSTDDSVAFPIKTLESSFDKPDDYEETCITQGGWRAGMPPYILTQADTSSFTLDLQLELSYAHNLGEWLLDNKEGTQPDSPDVPVENGASRYVAYSVPIATAPKINENKAEAFVAYTALVNTTALHAGPVAMRTMHSSLLNWVSGEESSITVWNDPLPITKTQGQVLSSFSAFVAVLFLVIAFSFIPATFAVFVVREREVAAKHQQLISGVSIPAYWASTYAWDMVNYLLPAIASISMLAGFGVLMNGGRALATSALIFLYGTAVAPFTYVISYAFSSHSAAQTGVLILNLLCLIVVLASFTMHLISSTCSIDAKLRFVYRLLPSYALGNGLQQLALLDQLPFLENDCGRMPPEQQYSQKFTAWSLQAAGWPLLFLAAESVIYFLIAVFIDFMLSYPVLRSKLMPDKNVKDKLAIDVDEDVARESNRVSDGKARNELIVLDRLRKVYNGKKVAVRALSFGVPAGECFGFLGINGAGKTTSMSMLSGAIVPTSGNAKLGGYDILKEQLQVRRLLGYCPQFDALLELLTVREHLELYARIKGVPSHMLENTVRAKLHEMDLVNYEHKLAGSLSGGNKRKLSVAIALIGAPRIVFLDEPSTGMDPVARRFMWRVISRLSARKECALMLTTHSMEEAEALCGRIGIMVGGRLRCIGSSQHLKSRFGKGYLAIFKIKNAPRSRVETCMEMMKDFLVPPTDSHLINPPLSQYSLPFSNLEKVCEELGDPSRVNMISAESTGWALHSSFQSPSRSCNAEKFAEWWTLETIGAYLHQFISKNFPGCTLTERHNDLFRYYLPKSNNRALSEIFGLFEVNRENLFIAEYSLSQFSLEDVFNSFAAQQDEETGVARGLNFNTVNDIEANNNYMDSFENEHVEGGAGYLASERVYNESVVGKIKKAANSVFSTASNSSNYTSLNNSDDEAGVSLTTFSKK